MAFHEPLQNLVWCKTPSYSHQTS